MLLRGTVAFPHLTEQRVIPSAYEAGAADRRRAMALVLVSLAVFLAAAPYAKVQLEPFVPFIALYESALVFNDFVTAMLLMGVYRVFRNRAYLVLACGYLFTAGMCVAHALSYPGLFSETGLLGAGEQSTAWLYMFWHAGFPMAVMLYAVVQGKSGSRLDAGFLRRPVLISIALVLFLVAALTYVATGLEQYLPPIMKGDGYTSEMPVVVRTVWGLSLAALAYLWIRRPHSVLDLWLMVVLCAWLFDIALAAVINQGRYDVGFYAGRTYGLLAVSFVMFVLLSENAKLQRRLLELQLEADRASRTKDLFLAMVGHELRNPLTSLRSGAHVLRKLARPGPLAEEAGELVERQVANMSRLVEDLVDVGRAARGHLKINSSAVDLAALVREVIESHRAAGKFADHVVGVRADPLHVHVDRQRMEQVVANLVTNSVKYTPAGKSIDVRVTRDGPHALLVVCDEGIGMETEVLERSFDWFYQANEALDRAQGGLGIGLALTRTLVELHGGTIQARSQPGKGTCLTVSLPLLPPPPAGPAP